MHESNHLINIGWLEHLTTKDSINVDLTKCLDVVKEEQENQANIPHRQIKNKGEERRKEEREKKSALTKTRCARASDKITDRSLFATWSEDHLSKGVALPADRNAVRKTKNGLTDMLKKRPHLDKCIETERSRKVHMSYTRRRGKGGGRHPFNQPLRSSLYRIRR